MKLKIVGLIGFLIFIFYNGMHYSMGWFDGVSFLVVLLFSMGIWIAADVLKLKQNFVIRNFSILLGAVYTVVWLLILMINGQSNAWKWVLVPVGYGLLFGVIHDLDYYRRKFGARGINRN